MIARCPTRHRTLKRDRAWQGVLKHLQRRTEAALAGTHLPTEEDLMLGMPFFKDELLDDIREYAGRMLRVLEQASPYLAATQVRSCIEDLTVAPSTERVAELARAVRGFDPEGGQRDLESTRMLLRCRIYLAAGGSSADLSLLALDVLTIAITSRTDENTETFLALAFRSFELLRTAAGQGDFELLADSRRLIEFRNPSGRLSGHPALRSEVEDALAEVAADQMLPEEAQVYPAALPATSEGSAIIVVRQIGNGGTSEGKRVAAELRDIVGKPLPMTMTSRTNEVASTLAAEFPHAAGILLQILAPVRDNEPIRIGPTILVGPPGSGKSHFARRVFELLGVPFDEIPIAGAADSALMGTSRRWSTGEPSMALSSVLRHRVANPGLILDEVEKAGTGNHNGNALDAILPMLETSTAAAYHDPYIQAPVDLSRLSWLMTANTIAPLKRHLRDRCRVIAFPPPDLAHLRLYVRQLLPAISASRGLSPEMAGLDEGDIALLSNWQDGSLRTLQKMIGHLLDDRAAIERRLPH